MPRRSSKGMLPGRRVPTRPSTAASADALQPVRAALGARRDAPDHWAAPAEATIRRTLGRLDAQALAGVIGAWLTDRDRLWGAEIVIPHAATA